MPTEGAYDCSLDSAQSVIVIFQKDTVDVFFLR